MEKLISQMQAVLTELTTILALAPAKNRTAIADALEGVATALKLAMSPSPRHPTWPRSSPFCVP